ncbi:hypothetical protein RI367_000725 [Sorochytrium milnesiophthora]
MILQVLSVFPDSDRQAVKEDLQRTGNVEATIENVLAGRVQRQASPPATGATTGAATGRQQNASAGLHNRQAPASTTRPASAPGALSLPSTSSALSRRLRSEFLRSKHAAMVAEMAPSVSYISGGRTTQMMRTDNAFLRAEKLDFAGLEQKCPGQLEHFTILAAVAGQQHLKHLCCVPVFELSELLCQIISTTPDALEGPESEDPIRKALRQLVLDVRDGYQTIQSQPGVDVPFRTTETLNQDFIVTALGVMAHLGAYLQLEEVVCVCLHNSQQPHLPRFILGLCYAQPWRLLEICRAVVGVYRTRPYLRDVVRRLFIEIAAFAPHRLPQIRTLLLRSKVLSEVTIALTLQYTDELVHTLQKLFADNLKATVKDIRQTPMGGQTLALELMGVMAELYNEGKAAQLVMALRSLVVLIVYDTFTLDEPAEFVERYVERLMVILSWTASSTCTLRVRNLLYLLAISSASHMSQEVLVPILQQLWQQPTQFTLQVSWHILSAEYATVRQLAATAVCAFTPIDIKNLVSTANALRSFLHQQDIARGVLSSQEYSEFSIQSLIYCLKNNVFHETETDPSQQVLALVNQAQYPINENILALLDSYVDSALRSPHIPLWPYDFVKQQLQAVENISAVCSLYTFYALTSQSKLRHRTTASPSDQYCSSYQLQQFPISLVLEKAKEHACHILKIRLVTLLLELCPAVVDVQAYLTAGRGRRHSLQLAQQADGPPTLAAGHVYPRLLTTLMTEIPALLNRTVVHLSPSVEKGIHRKWFTLYTAAPADTACLTYKLLLDNASEKWSYEELTQDPLLLFRVKEVVFLNPALFAIFSQIVRFFVLSSRHERAAQVARYAQQSSKPLFRKEHLESLLILQETAVVQCLLEICAGLPSTADKDLLIAVLPMLLEAPELERRAFICRTGATVCKQYPLPTTLALAQTAILPNIKTLLAAIVPPHTQSALLHQPADTLLPLMLAALVELAEAFMDVMPVVQQLVMDARSRLASFVASAHASPTTTPNGALTKKQAEALYDCVVQAAKQLVLVSHDEDAQIKSCA